MIPHQWKPSYGPIPPRQFHIMGFPSTIDRKARVWRVQVPPRDSDLRRNLRFLLGFHGKFMGQWGNDDSWFMMVCFNGLFLSMFK